MFSIKDKNISLSDGALNANVKDKDTNPEKFLLHSNISSGNISNTSIDNSSILSLRYSRGSLLSQISEKSEYASVIDVEEKSNKGKTPIHFRLAEKTSEEKIPNLKNKLSIDRPTADDFFDQILGELETKCIAMKKERDFYKSQSMLSQSMLNMVKSQSMLNIAKSQTFDSINLDSINSIHEEDPSVMGFNNSDINRIYSAAPTINLEGQNKGLKLIEQDIKPQNSKSNLAKYNMFSSRKRGNTIAINYPDDKKSFLRRLCCYKGKNIKDLDDISNDIKIEKSINKKIKSNAEKEIRSDLKIFLKSFRENKNISYDNVQKMSSIAENCIKSFSKLNNLEIEKSEKEKIFANALSSILPKTIISRTVLPKTSNRLIVCMNNIIKDINYLGSKGIDENKEIAKLCKQIINGVEVIKYEQLNQLIKRSKNCSSSLNLTNNKDIIDITNSLFYDTPSDKYSEIFKNDIHRAKYRFSVMDDEGVKRNLHYIRDSENTKYYDLVRTTNDFLNIKNNEITIDRLMLAKHPNKFNDCMKAIAYALGGPIKQGNVYKQLIEASKVANQSIFGSPLSLFYDESKELTTGNVIVMGTRPAEGSYSSYNIMVNPNKDINISCLHNKPIQSVYNRKLDEDKSNYQIMVDLNIPGKIDPENKKNILQDMSLNYKLSF